jgi:hypothetical protein
MGMNEAVGILLVINAAIWAAVGIKFLVAFWIGR